MRRQLLAAGLGRGAIAHRIATGRLAAIHPGVYVVGHDALAPGALELAAVLYCQGHAVLSHRSAAAVWGIASGPPHEAQLTIIGRNVRSRPGMPVTYTAEIDRRDLRRRGGLPVTAPARTMIDLAGCSDAETTERALAELRVLGLARDSELDAAMARCPTRRGIGRMRAILAAERGRGFTRSEGERRMRALVRRAQLPVPKFNSRLHGYQVDVTWPAAKLAVEVDGYDVHAHRAAFERDRRRDQKLIAHGYTVVRVTWNQLCYEPVAVIATVAQALALGEARVADPSFVGGQTGP